MSCIKPILVTGIHRSGTTFVGKMLSLPRSVGYIHEPFNTVYGIEGIPDEYYYVTKQSSYEPEFRRLIQRLLDGQASYRAAKQRLGEPAVKTIARALFKSSNNLGYRLCMLNPLVKRWLIKDPLAAMSSEYLHREFNMETVVVVRHPAAFVASVKRVKWPTRLDVFYNQSRLVQDHLAEDFANYARERLNPVEQAAFMWLLVYRVLSRFAERNAKMIVRRHEDLSLHPTLRFAELYNILNLSYSRRVEAEIIKFTDARNPADPINNERHGLRRNSVMNIKRWKNILSPGEVKSIRRIVEPLASRYYNASDW